MEENQLCESITQKEYLAQVSVARAVKLRAFLLFRGGSQMDSGMIGKIQKSKRYAQERERFQINALAVTIKGTNNDHEASFQDGKWQCDCDFFKTRGRCVHTMAVERIMGDAELEMAQPTDN